MRTALFRWSVCSGARWSICSGAGWSVWTGVKWSISPAHANSIYLIESKRADEISLIEVQEKAKAAIKYCNYATEYNLANGGKPWKYVLIPHDQILKNRSFRMVVNPNIL
ncbi:MAG: hypothetical protein GT600_14820 [Bacteroidales bacterium]|jgi:hypothetical protein|nr:hypothetical protein [Bacteroidales bacterium]HOU03267.1 hypothetical protein [Bacteroidales bacterium]HQK69299.1 hypothetical protein [Bacteroidales bacterium]